MSGIARIDIETDGPGRVVVRVTVGERRAKVVITPEHARQVALSLMTKASEAEVDPPPESAGDIFQSILDFCAGKKPKP